MRRFYARVATAGLRKYYLILLVFLKMRVELVFLLVAVLALVVVPVAAIPVVISLGKA
jgi:hypothetical protein